MAYLICSECGAHNPLDEKFCRVCQTSLADQDPVEDQQATESEVESFDLFGVDDKDLPDLLQGLKQEDEEIDPTIGLPEIDLDAEPVDEEDEDNPEKTEDASPADDTAPEEEGTPEWLETVRKRAREEEDAVGDMVRRVSAAQENVKDGRDETRHEDFESWIQRLRDEARDRAAGQPLPEAEPDRKPEPSPEPSDDDAGDDDWLTRIRRAHGTLDEEQETDAVGRSLLEWLVALEDEQSAGEPAEMASDDSESTASEETQRINLTPEQDERQMTRPIQTGVARTVLAALNLTREEQVQADLLTAVLTDEKADRSYAKPRYRRGFQWANAFFLLVLLVSLGLTLFTGGSGTLFRPGAPAGALALVDWVEALPQDADLVLIFDYQPAYAAEMDLVTRPLLELAAERAGSMAVVSSAATGPLLSEALLAQVFEDTATIPVEHLGYYPVESYGAYGMAAGLTPGPQAANLPAPAEALLDREVDGILIFSDRFEGAQSWVAQLHALSPETPLGLVVTAQAGPLMQPYVDSGQVIGMIAGLPDAAALEGRLSETGALGHRFRAYQAGVMVVIVALLLGAVSAPRRAGRNPGGEA
ncbi:hypothetical protein KQH50_03335 [bacterium]|nr:hypothetical protein [bacterium]